MHFITRCYRQLVLGSLLINHKVISGTSKGRINKMRQWKWVVLIEFIMEIYINVKFVLLRTVSNISSRYWGYTRSASKDIKDRRTKIFYYIRSRINGCTRSESSVLSILKLLLVHIFVTKYGMIYE